ncbi:MAG: glucosylceramidase [Segetibacter sp.]|nr:glucosylceramidase [Segetibacter sp.]
MKNMNRIAAVVLLFLVIISCIVSCSKSPGNNGGNTNPPEAVPASFVEFWKTSLTQNAFFAKQNTTLGFGSNANEFPTISVDTSRTYQSMDGFGYTLTGGSADLINALPASARETLLKELFSTEGNSIGVSYLRISIGASDLSSSVYTYDEMAAGQTDINLNNFSIDKERINLIPVLKQILAINPAIKIIATPWTAPTWMKTNKDWIGGRLNPAYYAVFADYFARYLQSMKAEGIVIDAITPQNEPLHGGNNPSMEMSAAEQADFIKNHLGPKLRTANLGTKIIIYDHNADRIDYPLEVLGDAVARPFIDGSSFHLYAGNIDALTSVHNAYPEKNIYFTEQFTSSTGSFPGDLAWHLRNLIIGAPRNWSRNVLEWNLANDAGYGPHTNGGCTTCLGAITISNNNITRNVAYYIIAHAAKFVRPGSVRVESNFLNNLKNVAFLTKDGKKVLIVLNDTGNGLSFNIKFKDKWVTTALEGGAVGTFVW